MEDTNAIGKTAIHAVVVGLGWDSGGKLKGVIRSIDYSLLLGDRNYSKTFYDVVNWKPTNILFEIRVWKKYAALDAQ
jgi:hypothetical protein